MSKSVYTNFLKEKQIYENKTFEDNVFEIDFITDGDVFFRNCVFKGIATFENLKIRDFSFLNCVFEDVLFISKSSFIMFGFTSCKFLNDLKLNLNYCSSYTVFRDINALDIEINGKYQTLQVVSSIVDNLKLIDVNNVYSQQVSKIEFLVENNINKLEFKSYENFSNIVFKGGEYESIHFDGTFYNSVYFEKKIIAESIWFESSIFKSRIDFNEGHFKNIYLYRCSFYGLVYFYGYDILENQTKDIKIYHLTIHASYFEKDISIKLRDLENLSLSNNTFSQIFNFNNFDYNFEESKMIFISLDGINQGNIIIENVYADLRMTDINLGNLYFKNMDLFILCFNEFHNKGNISFVNLKSGHTLVIEDSIIGNLNLLNEDINLFKEIIISKSNLKGLVLSIYPKNIRSYSSNPKFGYGIKDTSKDSLNLKNVYNQLKQVAKESGDLEHMYKYKSLELKKLFKTKRLSFDSILLLLNWISNNNGQSWIQGVFFTLLTSFLFFLIYLWNLNIPIDLKVHYKDYILFISSFPKLQLDRFSSCNKLWNISLIIWLSRIFISYGIYQTISAFRKYGKN